MTAPQLDTQNPWPGLLPFNEAAERYFHGREAETDHLLRLVQRQTLTVLFGKSGLGKTSLLLAGLFPRLRANHFMPIYIRLELHEGAGDPQQQVWAALADNLQRYRIDGRERGEGETLWEYFHLRDTEFWDSRNRPVTPVLVFDQFEEVFTVANPARIQPLLDALGDLVENRMPESVKDGLDAHPERAPLFEYGRDVCKVLLSFREDFLPEFERLRPCMPSLADERMRLAPMNGRQARDAILAAGGHLFAPGIAERIIGFVASSSESTTQSALGETELERMEVEPALLSVVCRELNNKRLQAGAERITGTLLAGTPSEIIEDFYNSAIADVDEGARRFIEDQLITSAGFRDSRALADALAQPGVTRSIIDRLVERRVLRLEERLGALRVELTHDRLTPVIRRQRDRRRQEEAERIRAEQAAAEIRREREQREAQERVAAEANARAREARRQFVRMRALAGVAAGLVVVAAGAFGWAWVEQKNANKSAEIAKERQGEADRYLQTAVEGASDSANLIMRNLGGDIKFRLAHAVLEKARQTFDKVPPDKVSLGALESKGALLNTIANTDNYLSDFDGQLQASYAEQAVGDRLVRDAPSVPTGRAYQVLGHAGASIALGHAGDLSRALYEFNAALGILREYAPPEPSVEWLQMAAATHMMGGFLFSLLHEWPKEDSEVQQAIKIRQEISAGKQGQKQGDPRDYVLLSQSLVQQGDTAAALRQIGLGKSLANAILSKDRTGLVEAVLKLRLAELYSTEAVIFSARGHAKEASEFFMKAKDKISELRESETRADTLLGVIRWQSQAAEFMREQSQTASALDLYQGIGNFLKQYQEQLIKGDKVSLKFLVPAIRNEVDIAAIHRDQGKIDQSRAELQRAIAKAKDLATKSPTYPETQEVWAKAYFGLGDLEETAGDDKSSLESFKRGLAIMKPLVDSHPTDAVWRHDLAVAERKEGTLRLASGDAEGGMTDLHAAESRLVVLAAKDPTNLKWRKDLEELRQQLASTTKPLQKTHLSGLDKLSPVRDLGQHH